MTPQPTLFDAPHTHSRPSDPATSQAAAELDHTSLRLQVLEQLRLLVDAGGDGATTYELQCGLRDRGIDKERGSIARRLTDLRDAGLVIDTGRTRPGAYERVEQTVWTVAP